MGSAQSARRIQPGGARPAVPGVPADLSRSPFLPTPPPARRSPPRPRVRRSGGGRGVRWGGARGRGRGWGRRGTAPRPATGRRRAHFHRGGAPRPAPGRLGRPGGEGGPGGAASPVGAGPPPPGVTAPRQQRSPNPGAEGAGHPSPRSPPRGRSFSRAGRGGGRASPPTARPLSHPPPPLPGARGAGRTVPSAPRASSRRRVRGNRRSRASLAGGGAERTGSAAMSATHPTRLETRTKESDACASQGLARKPPWRNEGEGPRPGARGGIPRPLQSAEGAPPARLARRAGEVEHERTRQDPKDGELCLGRAKPEETLVEVRSGPDVQIGRPTWV